MNRTIKFRALNAFDKNEWVYGYFCKDALGTAYITSLNGEDTSYVKANTVGQFTGLFDKNRKEIYEGDIVKLDTIVAEIFWNDGAFHIGLNREQGANGFIQDRAERFEIIGNIHQNPELLK